MYDASTRRALGAALGAAFLAGRWSEEAPARRLRHYDYQWLRRPGAPPRPIAAPEGGPALDPGRDPRPHPAARRRARLRARALRPQPRRAARRPGDRGAARPRGLLRLRDRRPRVRVFRTAGYPEAVAHALTALCTTVVPRIEWEALPAPPPELARRHWRLGRRLAAAHLPQGAPTSPALASLAATGLDRRLAGFAPTLAAGYSRYADDLVFSGPADLPARTLIRVTAEIARDEGFCVLPAKTRVRRAHERQLVCGVVVNAGTNVPREEYDRLKALLHDAERHGPAAANRAGVPQFRAHVLGRISWVASLHPGRGARLRARFERVDWEAAAR